MAELPQSLSRTAPAPRREEAWRPVRDEFPVLARPIRGRRLVYLDSAATTQKPRPVIEAVDRYYSRECANVHRGIHLLSANATVAFEAVRARVARWIGAASAGEVVFTSGTTAGINLVARAFGERFLRPGDEVLLTEMEHHSNIVPWQMACERTGASLVVAPIDDDGALDLEGFARRLSARTRLVALTHTSNALGTRNPVRRIADLAHAAGARLLVDGAQAIAHGRVDVADLGCDFLCFSGHKTYAPTGVGVLWGRADLLEELPPVWGGGEMIEEVRFERTTFKRPPSRFEAGTPPIAAVLGLGAALDWLERTGPERIALHEADLLDYATRRLAAIPGLRIVGTARDKASIVSFTLGTIHAHDVGQWLDDDGVAVRAGHHCAQPVMRRFGLSSTVRASFACYNERDDVDALAGALERTIEVFS